MERKSENNLKPETQVALRRRHKDGRSSNSLAMLVFCSVFLSLLISVYLLVNIENSFSCLSPTKLKQQHKICHCVGRLLEPFSVPDQTLSSISDEKN